MKVAYIAHPVSGDVKGNISKILTIVRQINLDEPEVVPFVPYLADIMALDDSIPEQRERGIKNDNYLIESGVVTELRLYGDRVSFGMSCECDLAEKLGISVINYIEGIEVGEKCNRDGCDGTIQEHEKETGCYCHAGSAPCSSCCHNYEYCPECGWEPEQP